MTGDQDVIMGPEGSGSIKDFILLRELAEVQLLLDNVSTGLSKRLPDKINDPLFQPPERWLEDICEIAWPPQEGNGQTDARNAAKLLKVKDELNRRAHPATGVSIAFTAMMVGDGRDDEADPSFWRRLKKWLRLSPQDDIEDGSMTGLAHRKAKVATRNSLAGQAYPGMAHHAWLYRWFMRSLWIFLVAWLVLTCWLSWDVAVGSSLLNRVNAIDTSLAAAAAPPVNLISSNGTTLPPGQNNQSASKTEEVIDSRLNESRQRAAANLGIWLGHDGWLRYRLRLGMGGIEVQDRVVSALSTEKARARESLVTNTEWASVFIGVLAGTVLPIFYGILGAAAAVVRVVSRKMQENTLVPRDLWLAWTQLGLGALIGACVGLFISQDGNAASDKNGLIGAVSLSPSALSFIAGFGVEGVFQALESLVKRVFNLDTPKPLPADGKVES